MSRAKPYLGGVTFQLATSCFRTGENGKSHHFPKQPKPLTARRQWLFSCEKLETKQWSEAFVSKVALGGEKDWFPPTAEFFAESAGATFRWKILTSALLKRTSSEIST